MSEDHETEHPKKKRLAYYHFGFFHALSASIIDGIAPNLVYQLLKDSNVRGSNEHLYLLVALPSTVRALVHALGSLWTLRWITRNPTRRMFLLQYWVTMVGMMAIVTAVLALCRPEWLCLGIDQLCSITSSGQREVVRFIGLVCSSALFGLSDGCAHPIMESVFGDCFLKHECKSVAVKRQAHLVGTYLGALLNALFFSADSWSTTILVDHWLLGVTSSIGLYLSMCIFPESLSWSSNSSTSSYPRLYDEPSSASASSTTTTTTTTVISSISSTSVAISTVPLILVPVGADDVDDDSRGGVSVSNVLGPGATRRAKRRMRLCVAVEVLLHFAVGMMVPFWGLYFQYDVAFAKTGTCFAFMSAGLVTSFFLSSMLGRETGNGCRRWIRVVLPILVILALLAFTAFAFVIDKTTLPVLVVLSFIGYRAFLEVGLTMIRNELVHFFSPYHLYTLTITKLAMALGSLSGGLLLDGSQNQGPTEIAIGQSALRVLLLIQIAAFGSSLLIGANCMKREP